MSGVGRQGRRRARGITRPARPTGGRTGRRAPSLALALTARGRRPPTSNEQSQPAATRAARREAVRSLARGMEARRAETQHPARGIQGLGARSPTGEAGRALRPDSDFHFQTGNNSPGIAETEVVFHGRPHRAHHSRHKTLEDLRQFEENARVRNALTEEIKEAIRAQTMALGRALVAEKLRPRSGLSHARRREDRRGRWRVRRYQEARGHERNPHAVAAPPPRAHRSRRGVPVAKSKPTQGFTALADADLEDLSYEQIVVDHPDEFSARAQWYARRTLGLPNDGEKPPAKGDSLTQTRTETLLAWLREQAAANHGRLPPFRNADSAAALGMADLHRYGRVLETYSHASTTPVT